MSSRKSEAPAAGHGTPNGFRAGASLLQLELTSRCPLACAHCYAGSGPEGTHGSMTVGNWQNVISQAAGMGVSMVQFIGGEPTAHPAFAPLLRYAVDAGLEAEVFTNLVTVKDAWWELFSHPSVSLATSYYSDLAAEHEAVTGRRGSHARTRANIAEAIRRAVPVRAGIIEVLPGQRVAQAEAELRALGVTNVGTDRTRRIGRAADTHSPGASELCGHCGRGRAAILPDGGVSPCVLARWMCAGNVRRQTLGEIVGTARWERLLSSIPSPRAICSPDKTGCKPKSDGPDCQPAEKPACRPQFR